MSNARLQWPPVVRASEVIKVRLLVQHDMDTGYLQDLSGKTVPRNVIRRLTCEYGGREVFQVEPSSGISSHPLFEFFFRAQDSGPVHVRWIDDRGQPGELRQMLQVLPAAAATPG